MEDIQITLQVDQDVPMSDSRTKKGRGFSNFSFIKDD